MKAAQLDRYAKDGRLVVREVPDPEPAANEVLIEVRAAAVNPLELLIASGSIRLIQDYRLPQTLGNECSGVVVKVGSQVRDFRPGDAVYTRLPLGHIGAFAEYVTVDEAAVAKIPEGYAFDVAAAIPLTALTAWQGLIDVLEAQAGQTLLITGGSGSFGQMAVPIARELGLRVMVTGNARAREEFLAMGGRTLYRLPSGELLGISIGCRYGYRYVGSRRIRTRTLGAETWRASVESVDIPEWGVCPTQRLPVVQASPLYACRNEIRSVGPASG